MPRTLRNKPLTHAAACSGSAEVGGAQSIQRGLQVLRHVAAQPKGCRLRDVTIACDLNKATAHRILTALVVEGFLHLDAATHVYELGQEAQIIGWSSRARQDIRALAQRSLIRICRASGDTVFLSLRTGIEAVCIDRHVGDFPIKTLTLEVGSRRPLGIGAGSLALLAFLPDDEIDEILKMSRSALALYPLLPIDAIRALTREARQQGYSFNNERVVAGMSAVGVPVLEKNGRPIAAISVAAITSRMTPQHIASIVQWLKEESTQLSDSRQMEGTAASVRHTE